MFPFFPAPTDAPLPTKQHINNDDPHPFLGHCPPIVTFHSLAIFFQHSCWSLCQGRPAKVLAEKGGPSNFKTFLQEFKAFRLIPVGCPARSAKPESFWKRSTNSRQSLSHNKISILDLLFDLLREFPPKPTFELLLGYCVSCRGVLLLGLTRPSQFESAEGALKKEINHSYF